MVENPGNKQKARKKFQNLKKKSLYLKNMHAIFTKKCKHNQQYPQICIMQ